MSKLREGLVRALRVASAGSIAGSDPRALPWAGMIHPVGVMDCAVTGAVIHPGWGEGLRGRFQTGWQGLARERGMGCVSA